MAAIDGKVTVVMKTGRMVKKGSGEVGFESDKAMTQALSHLIDVGKAEAAVVGVVGVVLVPVVAEARQEAARSNAPNPTPRRSCQCR